MGETQKQLSVKTALIEALKLYFEHFIILMGIALLFVVPTMLWTQFGNGLVEYLTTGLDMRWTRVLKTVISFMFYVLNTAVLATTLVYLNDVIRKKTMIHNKKDLMQAVLKAFWRVLGVQLMIYFCIYVTSTSSALLSAIFPKNLAVYVAFFFTVCSALVVETLFFLAPLWAVRGIPVIDSMTGSLQMVSKAFVKIFLLILILYVLRGLINDSLNLAGIEFAKTFPNWAGTSLFKHFNTILEALVNLYKAALMVAVCRVLPAAFDLKK